MANDDSPKDMNTGKNGDDGEFVEISAGNHKYLMRLPDRCSDYIQKKLATEKEPYEYPMLLDMQRRLASGDLVLDIGANIGNHTLFLAVAVGCRVSAFEPNKHLSAALSLSVSANGLGDRITVHPVGVGAKTGFGDFFEEIPENLGGQKIRTGEGAIPIVTIDSMDFDAPVKAIKIDVEGMELEVLKGAEALLNHDRPLLYVECLEEKDFHATSNLLEKLGYGCWDTFNATPTHLFVPREVFGKDLCFDRLRLKTAQESYVTRLELMSINSRLNDSYLKYRDLTGRAVALMEKLANEQLRSMTLQNSLLQSEKLWKRTEQQRAKLETKIANAKKTLALTERRRAKTQSRLIEIQSSLAYQLGCQLRFGFRSLRGFLHLPIGLLRLFRKAIRKRKCLNNHPPIGTLPENGSVSSKSPSA